MDVVSHGLWGGVLFGRRSRHNFWTAFSFGVSPDILSFGIFFLQRIFTHGLEFRGGPPAMEAIPAYVPIMYNITHSLVVFAIVFGIVWFLRKKPLWEMSAWGLHIMMDIFTHGLQFFPTPFLWPLSDYRFAGIPWSNPMIWYPNIAALLVLYILFWRGKKVGR